MRSVPLLAAAIVLLTGSGCRSARYVYKDAERGIVAIPSDSNSWPSYHRERAEDLMLAHFPQGFVIAAEWEEVVGQVTTHHHNTNVTDDEGEVEVYVGPSSSETRNRTEWRIAYEGP